MNKYKDTTFYLLDTDETYPVDDDGVQFLRGHSGGWAIYGNSEKQGVEGSPDSFFSCSLDTRHSLSSMC